MAAKLLAYPYPDPQVNLTLELFLRLMRGVLGDAVVSVITQGSLVFDDLAPGYSDLDFVVVVAEGLPEATLERLVEARWPLRDGPYGVLAHALEGPFLPRRVVDPETAGSTVCWGTSGERRWE